MYLWPLQRFHPPPESVEKVEPRAGVANQTGRRSRKAGETDASSEESRDNSTKARRNCAFRSRGDSVSAFDGVRVGHNPHGLSIPHMHHHLDLVFW